MGWADRLVSGHKDRLSFAGGGYKFLHSYEKKPIKSVVSVTVPVIAPGALADVDIAVTGAEPSRWQKVLAYEPSDFAATGVTYLTSTITGSGQVRLSFQNHQATPSAEYTGNFTCYVFRRPGTE